MRAARALVYEAVAHGLTLYLDGGRVRWQASTRPPDQLLARLRARREQIRDLLAAQPDPTPTPQPCLTCGSVVFWRASGATGTSCAFCSPCPSPPKATWYYAAMDETEAEMLDPETRRAVAWLDTVDRPFVDNVAGLIARVDRGDAGAVAPLLAAVRTARSRYAEVVR